MISQPIRLLFVSKSTGGLATYLRMLIKHLDREKYMITVACLSENGQEFAAELKAEFGVKTFSLEMNRYKVNLFTDTRVLFQLAAHIRREKYNLIHAHASKAGFLIRVAAIGTKIPVIYSPHNFAFHEGANPVTAWVVALLEKLVSHFTTKIITVSAHERDLALKYKVGSQGLYSVVPTGIDPAPFQQDVNVVEMKASLGIPASSHVVGAVGRLAIPKLPLDFVQAAAQLHTKYPDLHFVWVGSGPFEAEARELTRQLGLDEVIHWLGHRVDANLIYRIFDCFVLLSRWEANPLVILEAISAGVPVIASDNLGARELIGDGDYGMLVPIGNVSAVSEAIDLLIQNPEKASNMCRLAREKASNVYSLDKMMRTIEEIYTEKAMPL